MKHFFTFIVCAFLSLTMIAQGKMDDKAKSKDDKGGKFDRSLDYDYKVEKKAQVTVKGKAIPYQVTAATLPVWDESGKTIAGVFYTYYERTDVTDKASRPIVFSFNGGPGTASVWILCHGCSQVHASIIIFLVPGIYRSKHVILQFRLVSKFISQIHIDSRRKGV